MQKTEGWFSFCKNNNKTTGPSADGEAGVVAVIDDCEHEAREQCSAVQCGKQWDGLVLSKVTIKPRDLLLTEKLE